MFSVEQMFEAMVQRDASDLYLTVGVPATLRVADDIETFGDVMDESTVMYVISSILNDQQQREFHDTLEFNTAISWEDKARFRVNVFMQQQQPGLVIRKISTEIPTFEELKLPDSYRKLVMEKRGLILVVGPTGSGKSSSLAAMIGHRNEVSKGHIITIEDPIEFMHAHKQCIVTQRDVGIDTISFESALKNALRQRPDVVLIGEIRDKDTMEHAVNFAETGHLCLATLHANNAYQAIERILSFFPEEKHKQVQMNLALNLKGILSQRLVADRYGGRSIAIEVLLNQGLIKQLIEQGKIKEILPVMEKNQDIGMRTFEQSLLELWLAGAITEEVALAESDNPGNLQLKMKQANPTGGGSTLTTRGSNTHHHIKI